MPALYEMTWTASTRRWARMYKGRRYTVSCRQLTAWAGKLVPETKEGSYQTANAWWTAKRAEIDSGAGHPQAAYLKTLAKRQEWAASQGLDLKAEAFREERERVQAGEGVVRRETPGWVAEALQVEDSPALDDSDLDDDSPLWRSRLTKHESAPKVAKERTVGGLLDKYLAFERSRVASGQVKPSNYAHLSLCLKPFREWIGNDTPIAEFDEAKWEDYFTHLVQVDISPKYRQGRFKNARAFLQWCCERRAMTMPANLFSRKLAIRVAPKPVEFFTPDEVGTILGAATDRMRLYVLMALNCGMYQSDLSELHPSEVDWQAGTVTRRRTKTANNTGNVPTVRYPLWPSTFALLKQFRSDDPEHVLLNEHGRKLRDEYIRSDGVAQKRDTIHWAWKRLAERCPVAKVKTFRHLRKTGSSTIEEHPIYGRLSTLYLGNAPATIAQKHYAAAPQKLFDECVKWLGETLGLA